MIAASRGQGCLVPEGWRGSRRDSIATRRPQQGPPGALSRLNPAHSLLFKKKPDQSPAAQMGNFRRQKI